ncbi:hypothetical protein ACFXGE_28455, partial [Streptomyces sp. NPDC059378]
PLYVPNGVSPGRGPRRSLPRHAGAGIHPGPQGPGTLPENKVEARPDEADRQTRDYAKDLWHAALPAAVRDETGRIELSLEVQFLALCCQPGLNCRIRQDIFYLAGRAAMALDLGHLEAAEREIRRMERVGSTEPQNSRSA